MKKALSILIMAACASAAAAACAFADSPGRLVSKGNREYHKKAYAKALDLYDKASVKAPESAIVSFNKGDALYRTGDYEKAREQFQQAASKTKSLPFESKAWYNLGNCSFESGKRQEDSDLKKALESLEECVKFYSTSLEKDPTNKPAAENLEIARLKIKDLLDKMKKQQKQGGQGNQQNQQGQQGEQKEQSGEKPQQGKQQEQAQQQSKEPPKKDEKNKQGSPKEQPKKQLARDATAREILDQEKKDRKDQQVENAGGYHPVDKDW